MMGSFISKPKRKTASRMNSKELINELFGYDLYTTLFIIAHRVSPKFF
ncbi:hypothetical protein HCH_01203 [Hahella chejuensis KCTC 2396]|uniref:Uncharacterized protein n=1 Tax=Hahella chejuensis (strain KCTC 2396) TaxID=349521 RepID=Q2SMP8_HAHCH|nr:hypothetical protein HCH_01203 [Hahella chejuensis KCTC 2396]